MKAVLVTGATTPLGHALVNRLVDRKDVEHVLALGIEPPHPNPFAMLPDVTYVQVDLTRERKVRELLYGPVKDLGVQAVVHAAQHRRAHAGGGRVHALNVESTRLLLRLAEEHPTIRSFILRSDTSVYLVRAERPRVIREDQALNLKPSAPQWIRDRVEADLTACAAMGVGELSVKVLRFAEIVGPDMGSQLHDYLTSAICFRPMGYDPMLNLLSVTDAARALELALLTDGSGVFNIAGKDTLPVSAAIRKWGRVPVTMPGWFIGPLYRARARTRGTDFRYDLNHPRFHLSVILDGTKAWDVLGYRPEVNIRWPAPEAGRPVFGA